MSLTRTGILRASAAVEAGLAAVLCVGDWLVPSLLLSAMAVVSLLVRREPPSSLGFHRPVRPWLLAAQMLAVAAALAVVDVGLFLPLASHLSGQQQDTSDFAELHGNIAMLLALLVLGWTLAAFVEEFAFRGYLFSRVTEALGGGRSAGVIALMASSVLFGAVHAEQGVVGMVIAAIDGLVLGALRIWKGTLWAPILAHGFDDTIGFVAFYLVGPITGIW